MSPRSRASRALAAALATCAAPSVALACAVCGGGNPANRQAFFLSTIALSLIPFGLFAGAFLWLRSQLSDRGSAEFRERERPADKAPSERTAGPDAD